jgi:hypothetical protein
MRIGERSNTITNKRERVKNRKLNNRKSCHKGRKEAVEAMLQESW